jgi:hypothetical protein
MKMVTGAKMGKMMSGLKPGMMPGLKR